MATQNIPGVQFEYKDDGRLIPVLTGPITDTVLIIGNAVDGPINTPVRVNAKNVEQVFGPIVYNAVYSSAAGARDFGKYNGNNLVKAYSEVIQGGCTDIIMMRVGDSTHSVQATAAPATGDTYVAATNPASGTYLSTNLGIDIKAKYPGTVYNGVGLHVTYAGAAGGATSIILEVLQGMKQKGRTLSIVVNNGAGTTISKRELIARINADLRNTTVVASSLQDDITLDSAVPLDSITTSGNYYWVLQGGTDGTRTDFGTAAAIYEALMGWTDDDTAALEGEFAEESPFARLESVEADVVYMAALYADENIGDAANPATIAVPLAAAVYNASKNDYPMVAVIGTRPSVDAIPPRVSSIVDKLTTSFTGQAADAVVSGTDNSLLNMGYFVSQDASSRATMFDYLDPDTSAIVDLGRYILCVAGPDVILTNTRLGQYIDTGAGVYAGLLSTVPPHRASTNMTLPGVKQLSYSFTNRQLNKICGGQPYDETNNMSGLGGSYVVFRRNVSGDIVVNLDNTCASRESDYASYQILYIVNMVASGLKKVAEPFIGMVAHATTKTALDNQVKKFLDYVAETRAIAGGEGVGYSFKVSASGVDQLLGRINIDLQLRPALQIKAINVTISVAPPNAI